MIKHIIIGITVILLSVNFNGQNLVSNGDFEKTNKEITVQVNQSCSVSEFNKMFDFWKTNKATPDVWSEYYMKWGADTILVKNQGNFIGCAFGQSYSENIYTHLSRPIQKGKIYQLNIKIGMANRTPHTFHPPFGKPIRLDTTFGIAFSNEVIEFRSFLLGQPHIHFNKVNIVPGLWTTITRYFESEEDYSYLTIGQFDKREGDFLIKSGRENIYLLIDDVSLLEVDSIPKAQEDIFIMPPSAVVSQVDTFTFNGILFETGSASIGSSMGKELDFFIKKIEKKDFEQIEIIGHTDDIGSDILNQKLSNNRAKKVFDYLMNKGLNTDKMTFKGAGSSFPIASNNTEIGRAKNRRVEIIVTNKTEKTIDSKSLNPVHQPSEPYLFSKDIKESPTQSWDYTDITNYQKAIEVHDFRASQTLLSDTVAFEKHQPVSAKKYILAQTQKHQITLINEAHHYPKNRAFVTELLPELYQQGYRYIGLEALYTSDSLINQRKYPVLASGDMTREPLMGDLVRRAIQLGFTIFGYDADYLEVNKRVAEMKKTASADALAYGGFVLKMNARDRIQAENIADFIKNKPNSKILIMAGFGHIKELSSDFWSPMAYQLQQLTGINPLTIDQAEMIECATPKDESIFYRKAMNKSIKEPSVFLKDGTPFIAKIFDPNFPEQYVKFFDIQVFHPRTNWSRPRPTWMAINGYRRPFKLKIPSKLSLPLLAMAFKIGEDIKTAVPMDVVECKNSSKDYFLMLPKSKYLLIYKNEKYKIIHREIIEVR